MRNEEKTKVVLVDADGVPTGETMEKLAAHEPPGFTHEAVTALLFASDESGNRCMLAQQRVSGKYHAPRLLGPGMCSHTLEGELPEEAVTRRLDEELGVKGVQLVEAFAFHYCVPVGNKVEDEYDHVFVVEVDVREVRFQFDPEEVIGAIWVRVDILRAWMEITPEAFAPWLLPVLKACEKHGVLEEVVK